jgi:adenosylcobalamin-dependent ribonucleoside-triphosphate reductase
MTEMSARALAVYQRTYSRPKSTGGHETFHETIDRVVGHQRWLWCRALGLDAERAPAGAISLDELNAEQELEELRALMLDRKVLPSGRTMWLGGTEIARTRELTQFACSGAIVKTVYDVVDQFWLLLNGCGIGVKPMDGVLNGFARPITDVHVIRSSRTIEDGPSGEEANTETFDRETGVWTIRVGDSGEAWARAAGKLVAGKWPATTLVLDFRAVRAEGSLLSRYGWRSSGDAVISKEFPLIAAILSRRAGQLLRKLDIADLVNHLGVIQTGRRGAEILLMDEGDPEVEEFVRFKAGVWSDPAISHRSQSNNSVLFWEKPSRARLKDLFDAIVSTGGSEPGFINAAAARLRAPWFTTANPCVEILLGDKSFCNLFEVDVAKFNHLDDLLRALYLVGRANYRQTMVNLEDGVLQRSWHELNEFLHLCGVSITGVARRPDLTAHDLKMMRSAATMGAWSMADALGSPRPKNVTCVKPSGTLGKVMDTSEGAHKPLGRYVFNSIVYGRTDPLVGRLRDAGYEVRPHPTADTQVLVKFPVEFSGIPFEDFGGVPVNMEPAVAQLARYKLLMDWWCDQNCSVTISYSPEEVPAIIDWLVANWDSYVGVSWAFRADPTKTAADLGFSYLPQAVVSKAEFDSYRAGLRPVDVGGNIGGAAALDDLEDDCEGGVCPVR